jgi:hypothetical protein
VETNVQLYCHIQKSVKDLDPEWHYVYGPVYIPLQVDVDGETMTATDIMQLAHDFIANGLVSKIDIMHDKIPSGAQVVESYLTKEGDPDGFPPGTWILGTRIPADSDAWDKVEKGELNGYSFNAMVQKIPQVVAVDIAKIVTGTTYDGDHGESGVPTHRHNFYVEFNDKGRVIVGATDMSDDGHFHQILGTVVTEEAAGHSHRFEV